MCLIIFMMTLQVMKPQLVTDHQSKERKMEDPTIELCENNVNNLPHKNAGDAKRNQFPLKGQDQVQRAAVPHTQL